uniref:Uncharacterized protein n=1 Tax=Anguilla anguilla TaxID=7936 RepID=A0A0E9WGX1_ANGAN
MRMNCVIVWQSEGCHFDPVRVEVSLSVVVKISSVSVLLFPMFQKHFPTFIHFTGSWVQLSDACCN